MFLSLLKTSILLIMRLFISFFVIAMCAFCSLKAQSHRFPQPPVNEDSIQKVRTDSIQRVWMRDSLSLSDSIISQVFALKDTCFAQTLRIRSNTSLTPAAQIQSVSYLRKETEDAIKDLMGENTYADYKEMIVSGKKRSQ